MEITRVLLPVDGSRCSVKAAEFALSFVNSRESNVLLLHCHKPFPAFLGEPYHRPTSAYYFYAAPQAPDQPERRGIRTDRFTFVVIRHAQGDEFILHDNERDPYQLENIAEQEPGTVRALTKELNEWLRRTNDMWQLPQAT